MGTKPDGTYIYGCSDDLVEVVGLESCDDELNPVGDGENFLGCSDGTLLGVVYGDNAAQWKFFVIAKGSAFDRVESAFNEDGPDHPDFPGAPGYSDVVVFKSRLSWVTIGEGCARRIVKREAVTP